MHASSTGKLRTGTMKNREYGLVRTSIGRRIFLGPMSALRVTRLICEGDLQLKPLCVGNVIGMGWIKWGILLSLIVI